MNKKKILLFGGTGMAGHMTYYYLKNTGNYEITSAVYRNKLTEDCVIIDVRNKEAVSELIRLQKPDYIINCVGILIKGTNEYPDNAILLNSYFPHLLARIADEIGSKLIHISTDCVFSGNKGEYGEEDFRDTDDTYGRSKALGEIISDRHLTLRTSIIGPEIKKDGEGLFQWFMNQKGEIKGFSQAFWSGITTLQLAKSIELALQRNLTGLMHVTNGEKISKFNLLLLFKEIWKRESLNIVEINVKNVDKSLCKSKYFNFEVPSYAQMLVDQKNWIDTHKTLYDEIYY